MNEKENATDMEADGVNQSHELTSAIPNKTRWSSGFTLRDDAMLYIFVQSSKAGAQNSNEKALKVSCKGIKTRKSVVSFLSFSEVERWRKDAESGSMSRTYLQLSIW